MSIRSSALVGRSSSPLNFKRTALSIRSLEKKRRLPYRSAIDRVRGEFDEMRGFSPTIEQAARLFDLSPDECNRVLGALVQDGSLRKGEDGRYRRI